MGLMLECGAYFGITVVVTHDFEHIACHIRPVIIVLHSVSHTKFSKVAGKRGMM